MSFGGLMSMVIAEEYCGYIQRYKQFPDKSICNKLAKKIYRQLIARFEHTFEDPSLPIQ